MTQTTRPDAAPERKLEQGSVLGSQRDGWMQRGYVPAGPSGHVAPPPVIVNQPSSVVAPKK